MRFSEYLRTLDEGNYGHEYGQESDAHEEALRANREHAAAKRAESTMAPKPPVEPDPKVGDNLKKIAAAKPAETADDNAKRKEWRDSLRSTGDDGGAKAARENTVKEPNGETMLDPKTGKPFPKTGPLKDWQIPSLKEDWRQTDPGHTREDEEDVPDKPVNTKRWDGHGKEPDGYEDAGGPIGEDGTAELRKKTVKKNLGEAIKQAPGFVKKPKFPSIRPNESDADTATREGMRDREAGEQRLKDTIAHSEAKRKANESVEIPMRDALGRLSIYSMTESSTPKPLRKALKKAKMGKKLSNKESGNVMNNPKADGSTRTNAAENYKNPQDDIDANDAAEGEYRSGDEGTPRQSHLDK
jgi:hypothetical protein